MMGGTQHTSLVQWWPFAYLEALINDKIFPLFMLIFPIILTNKNELRYFEVVNLYCWMMC